MSEPEQVRHEIEFQPSGRGKAQCPTNPEFPKGIVHDMSMGRTSCAVELPYPAPECGRFVVTCKLCEIRIIITAAGRADDPRSVKIPCQLKT